MAKDLLTTLPPASLENEKSVIGSMMYDRMTAMQAMSVLKTDDFYDPVNRAVFSAIVTAVNDSQDTDTVTIENILSSQGKLDSLGGSGVISEYLRATGSPESVEYYCAIVKNKAKTRRLINHMQRTISRAYDPSEDIDTILKESESQIYNLLIEEGTGGVYTMKQVMDGALKQIMHAQEFTDGIIGLPSSLPYDQTLGGFQKAKMYVIAGRPGMGKTAFMLQNILNITKDGHNCGIISLEMGNVSLGMRMMLSHAGIDTQRAQTGRLNHGEVEAVKKAAGEMAGLGVFIDDTTQVDPSVLRIKARMMKQVHKIDLLAVDYVQLMTSNKESREQQVAEISRTCKELSKELDIPVLALAQLSRKPDDRRGWATRPELSDLRESGSLEQDADVVMFLYQPSKYSIQHYPGPPEGDGVSTEGITEVIIKKHRDGPTAKYRLIFEPQYMKYLPYSPSRQQTPPIQAYDDDTAHF